MELPSLLQSTETNSNENHHIHHSVHHSTRGSLTRKHTNSTTGVLGLCDCCPETPLSTTRNIITLLNLRRRSIHSIRSVRCRGVGCRSRDSIHRTGSQADIQQGQ